MATLHLNFLRLLSFNICSHLSQIKNTPTILIYITLTMTGRRNVCPIRVCSHGIKCAYFIGNYMCFNALFFLLIHFMCFLACLCIKHQNKRVIGAFLQSLLTLHYKMTHHELQGFFMQRILLKTTPVCPMVRFL